MSQLALLRRILSRPNIYATPWQREAAKAELKRKCERRDRKVLKRTQLAIDFTKSRARKRQ